MEEEDKEEENKEEASKYLNSTIMPFGCENDAGFHILAKYWS